ncbi:GNAT family N-acetyltransferase [Arenibacter troitsensis]|uniref:Ribosomal protein S18 acetylase RimI n=1 Tax=Arenibacter troitsensis TaxID=188872 RepID=A0A1X7KR93_9FLAO|nr:GNAT family N-acetyltransferase [Arenibacter troitsensis]SMG44067.1 Ribosomal protein S18 acetylase RimI [Arenibacter troitsensis]
MKLHLRPCSITDLEVLINLGRRTFIEAFEKDNKPEDFKIYLDSAFREETLYKELQDINSAYYFIYMGSSLVGYIKLNENEAQSDINDINSIELERIYVLAEFQGHGIGEWVLRQVISIAKVKNRSYVWLGVWEHNPKAIKFYQRLGFYNFGTHPYFIGNDEQTDWLMRLDI